MINSNRRTFGLYGEGGGRYGLFKLSLVRGVLVWLVLFVLHRFKAVISSGFFKGFRCTENNVQACFNIKNLLKLKAFDVVCKIQIKLTCVVFMHNNLFLIFIQTFFLSTVIIF